MAMPMRVPRAGPRRPRSPPAMPPTLSSSWAWLIVPASEVIAGLCGRRLATRRTSWERFTADLRLRFRPGHCINQGYAMRSLDGSPIARPPGTRLSRPPQLGLEPLEFRGTDSASCVCRREIARRPPRCSSFLECADCICVARSTIALGEARRELARRGPACPPTPCPWPSRCTPAP